MIYHDSNPLVSIIIPTYERGIQSKISINSAICQTYKNIEIIIVEDGSNSGLSNYLSSKDDIRINYYTHPKRRGLAAARNTGIKMSKGKYVAFLDDDDGWLRDKIKLQVDIAEKIDNKDIMIYCGGDGNSDNSGEPADYFSEKGKMSDHLFNGLTFASSSMLIRRESLLSIGGHSDEMISCVDHDLWFKMAQSNFAMDYVSKKLIYNNKTDSSMTSRLNERLFGIQQFFEKWRDYVSSKYGYNNWKNIERIYHNQILETAYFQYKKGVLSLSQAFNYVKKIYDLQGIALLHFDKLLFRSGKLHLTPVTNNKMKIFKSLLHL